MAYTDAMNTMITKIRALIEDFSKSSVEVFIYETSNVFTLAEPRILEITKTLINGQELQSGQSSTFDVDTNQMTVVNEEFVSGDVIEFHYDYTDYSDTELFEYVRAALVWFTLYDNQSESYKLKVDGTIVPAPEAKQLDLICIIASILIKPDYISYKTSNMSVTYPSKAVKEDKIRDLITNFQTGVGVISIIQYDRVV